MKSIMHQKDGTCYLCIKLNGDYDRRSFLEEHHVLSGTANRKLSEKYGLKVYLCPEHHTGSSQAVHMNYEIKQMLCRDAQECFERKYPNLSFRDIFGKNYIAHKYSVREEKETIEKGFWIYGDDGE